MASQLFQQNPDAELQAAFRRHLPQRLHTLLRRARAQCRNGWDCNVMRALHDEVAMLAGACGRYGMLEIGERLLALEAALEPAIASQQLPDTAATAHIGTLLDALRPHLPRAAAGTDQPAQASATAAAKIPFPRCEVPPAGYWPQAGLVEPAAADSTAANDAPTIPHVVRPRLHAVPRGPRVRIVNDDAALVNELLLNLDHQGCDVALVEHFDDLLELLRRDPPELAVMVADAHTPLDALAKAVYLARLDQAQRMRLLVLPRTPDVNLRLHALRAGADRCLALSATTSAEVAAAVRELTLGEPDDPYRVLIVDDDAPQALFAQAILRRAGMQTKILDEALAVLDELDKFKPDLLLLDLNMPGCDGFELTTLIREREGYVNTPIVFLSGELDEERQFAALDAGGDDFLMKPIRPTHLTSAVTNRIRRARAAAAQTRRRRDAVAGLQPRARLLEALSEHFAAAAGRAAPGGLLTVQLRDGDALSAQLGPTAFEQLLAELGAFIVAHTHADAVTARHDGAGYLLFTAHGGAGELAAQAGELVRAVTDQRFGARATALQLDCAVCAFTPDINEPAAALAALGQALKIAHTTKDGVAAHPARQDEPDALAERIGAALANDAFGLAFQAILPARGAAAPHFQALLRLHADAREFTAAELVPAATRAGLIGAIDAWVIARCLDILAQRNDGGDNLRIIASQSLAGWRDPARCGRLAERLDAAGVAPERLVLEFRCDASRDGATLAELAGALKRTGVRLSLAEFDVATADWIDHLPLDYVKLVPDIAGAALAGAVTVAHSCNLRVIAPHVETAARAEALRLAGVDMLQGNWFRSPAATLDAARPEGAA